MRVAFYAPLKPPDHAVPSGDRRVAQLLLEALRLAGHDPFIAARLRSFDGNGDPARQARLAKLGRRAAERLLRRWRQAPHAAPQLWFTYHLYYKAPDWLGPAVSRALGIPYVVAEASHAAKREGGAWHLGHRAVADTLRHADAVIGLNPADRDGVLPLLRRTGRWIALPPFLDAEAYRGSRSCEPGPLRLVTVAMMRSGDKLASYQILGAALKTLQDLDWSLTVVGDGPARGKVAAALAPLGSRVLYRGMLGENETAAVLREADMFVWPAINEAYGMAILEAQAAAVPVVAGASGGVPGIVAAGETGLLVPPGDPAAFAAAVRQLIVNNDLRATMGIAARANVERDHDLPVAAARLAEIIDRLGQVRAA